MSDDFLLDHVCLAVRNLEQARALLERTVGYVARTEPVENTRQAVIVQFMQKAGSIDIKLIQPSTPDSSLLEFMKSTGGGLHHLAFRTESVIEASRDLEEHGARIVAPPEPGEAFEDGLIAFAYIGSGLRVELIDTDLRRGELDEAKNTPPVEQ